MAFRFDFGETFSRAVHAAEEVAKGASEVIGSAAKDAASAAEDAGNAIVDTAASASEAVGSAMCSAAEGVSNASEQIASSDAGKAIAGAANAVGGIAVGAAMGLAQGASSLASGAESTVEGGINVIKENLFSARLRKARIKGFRDGIKQGAYLAGQKRYNFIYAYVDALLPDALRRRFLPRGAGVARGRPRLPQAGRRPSERREDEGAGNRGRRGLILRPSQGLPGQREHRVAGFHR